MADKAVITTAQPVVMAAAAADLLLDMGQAVAPAVKAIPVHQAVIIGQATEAAEHPVQVLVCKVDQAPLAQSPALVYLEQGVAVVAEIVQSIVVMATRAAAEATVVLQIGATATTHTVKILAEDGA